MLTSDRVDDAPVPRRYVRKLLQLAAAQGLDPAKMMHAAGILDPDTRIVAASYSRLYHQLCQALADECFGFYPGRPLACGHVELLCRILLSAADLGQAISLTSRFFTLRGPWQAPAGDCSDCAPAPDLAGLIHPPVDRHAVAQVFALQNGIAGALSAWHRLLGWLIGGSIPLRQVTLRGQPAVNLDKFERIFRCPIQFGAPLDALWFHADWRDRPIVRSPTDLQPFLRLAPYHLIAQREADAERPVTLAEQVGDLIATERDAISPDLPTAARLLGLSARTLRRRLEAEGCSFQHLKDHRRRQLAQQLLLQSPLSIQAVAERCGYQEASTFHRAFLKWTGMTPGRFRTNGRASGS